MEAGGSRWKFTHFGRLSVRGHKRSLNIFQGKGNFYLKNILVLFYMIVRTRGKSLHLQTLSKKL